MIKKENDTGVIVKKYVSKYKEARALRAQAIVEFALALPILLMLLIGIFEFGRMVFVYSAVTNASREAVRFASAFGFGDATYHRQYQYCSAIRQVAKRHAFLMNLQDTDITIEYDHGPGTSVFDTCPSGVTSDQTIIVKTGQDRVKVTVIANYTPMTKFFPIGNRIFTSSSSRTILGFANVGP
jgi:Flp pilus assembly protein TadG